MGLSESQERELRAAFEQRAAETHARMAPQREHAEGAGRRHGLGAPSAIFLDEQPDPWGTSLGAAAILQGLAAAAAAATVYGEVQRGTAALWPLAALPVLLLVGAVVCGTRSWGWPPRRSWVYLFADGLVTVDHRGAERVVRWADVVGADYVWESHPEVPHSSLEGYRLRVAGAGDVVLRSRFRNAHDPWSVMGDLPGILLPRAVAGTMPGFDSLGDAVERHVVRGLARQALARARSSPVDLGPVRLGAGTISVGARPPVRWQEITAWQVSRDVLRIDTTGGRAARLRVDLSTVPDGWVVVQALMLQGGRPPGPE